MKFMWLLALLPLAAAAQEQPTLFDQISLQAEASQTVANDRMRALLSVQDEDRDPARLAERINQTMQWALEKARAVEGITAETTGYRTQPVYRDGTLSHWRASQTLSLESGEFPALSRLAGSLQERLTVQSMQFTVSEASRRAMENQLIDEALSAFRARADRVSSNFNAGGWRIVHLHINTPGGGPGPIALYRAEAADRTMPAVEAGTSEVTVNISGTVQLLPGQP